MIFRLSTGVCAMFCSVCLFGCSEDGVQQPADTGVPVTEVDSRTEEIGLPAVDKFPPADTGTLPEQTVDAGDRLVFSGTMTISDPLDVTTVEVRIMSGTTERPIMETSGSTAPKLVSGDQYRYIVTLPGPVKPGRYTLIIRSVLPDTRGEMMELFRGPFVTR